MTDGRKPVPSSGRMAASKARLGMVRSTLTAAITGPAARCQRTSTSAIGKASAMAAARAVIDSARCRLAAVSKAPGWSASQARMSPSIRGAPSASHALRRGGAQAPLDVLQRLVGRDRQQRGEHGAGRNLLAEILGDALEDDVAQAAGIDIGGNGGDRDLRDHGDADA